MTAHKWQFTSRFRRHAFGWRSDTPIQRIKEALAEIKAVARKEPVLAALRGLGRDRDLKTLDDGPGQDRHVCRTRRAHADVDPRVRQRWLERLWQALQDDDIPYIESLGEHWGELCVTSELAMVWVDEFLPLVEHVWSSRSTGHGFFKGTSACLASLYAAGRHDQLLTLLERAPFKWWHDRQWGVKALAAMGKKAEAVRYAEQSRGLNDPGWMIAEACEAILLSSGLAEDAYRRYAIEANQGTTNLATFRAIAKKYPNVPPEQILRDLVASTPGTEGKWFAAAKDAGLFNVAIDLATTSPTDPRTLARAARDFAESQPEFAVAAGLASLRWISLGHGYDITGADVIDAYSAVMQAAAKAGVDAHQIKTQIGDLLASTPTGNQLMKAVLAHHLTT